MNSFFFSFFFTIMILFRLDRMEWENTGHGKEYISEPGGMVARQNLGVES